MKKERNYGIDLLRIIAMLMVVVLHVIGYGEYNLISGVAGKEAWTIRIFCTVAVNCYVLITGYFMCEKEFSLKRVVMLWVEMIFYSAIVYLVCSATKIVTYSNGDFMHALMPFVFKNYWFIQTYILLLLLTPLLNAAINNLSKTQYKFALLLIVGFWCFVNNIISFFNQFDTSQGYGIMWFIVLYFTAGYLRKFYTPDGKKAKFIIVYFVLSAILSITSTMFGENTNIISYLISFDYNSIFIYVSSVALFLFFLNVRIKNKFVKYLISFVSPLTFAVYLIHHAPCLKNNMWSYINKDTIPANAYTVVFVIAIIALAIFAVCILIEFVRKNIFKLLKIDFAIGAVSDKLETAIKNRLAK